MWGKETVLMPNREHRCTNKIHVLQNSKREVQGHESSEARNPLNPWSSKAALELSLLWNIHSLAEVLLCVNYLYTLCGSVLPMNLRPKLFPNFTDEDTNIQKCQMLCSRSFRLVNQARWNAICLAPGSTPLNHASSDSRGFYKVGRK